MSGLIRRLYKYVKVDLSTLYLTYFSMFNRLEFYTILALQIFYLMKRKIKEDLQVNLWDFSRQSDDMMSEF